MVLLIIVEMSLFATTSCRRILRPCPATVTLATVTLHILILALMVMKMIPPGTFGLLVGDLVGNVVFFPVLDLLFEVDFGFFALVDFPFTTISPTATLTTSSNKVSETLF
jgi:hypothetical protein